MVFEKALVRRISDECLDEEIARRRESGTLPSANDAEAESVKADREAYATMIQTIRNDMTSCSSQADEYKYLNYVQALLTKLISADYDNLAMYDHIHTNGAYWLENNTNAEIDRIHDFRIAVLFWLETEKIRRDSNRAFAEQEENKKRFIQK